MMGVIVMMGIQGVKGMMITRRGSYSTLKKCIPILFTIPTHLPIPISLCFLLSHDHPHLTINYTLIDYS